MSVGGSDLDMRSTSFEIQIGDPQDSIPPPHHPHLYVFMSIYSLVPPIHFHLPSVLFAHANIDPLFFAILSTKIFLFSFQRPLLAFLRTKHIIYLFINRNTEKFVAGGYSNARNNGAKKSRRRYD